ncbi:MULTISPECIES: RICIN domain-containing protein [Calothrix]|uniref:RICIN domain-containing protein n=2 Tax=Calothrix TaxID=1186 RepID=A0ABR8AJN9_9CYAN|nr:MULTISPECIES: RICIN domain-containing protein [Calothrix]MBD2199974.1 RICIN domain-containing protein [Calothrix parietina FACHB-288]MBD2228859.1 RICIN domain-containing protein [Calothrix anomala FACHB-343]
MKINTKACAKIISLVSIVAAMLPITAEAQSSEYYILRAKHSDKCFHVVGDRGTGNGVPITQYECVDQPNLQWKLEKASGEPGYYFIRSRWSGRCAQVVELVQQNGAAITQWDCVNQDNVKWSLDKPGNGYYFIKAKHSNKCAQVVELSQNNGAAITQWDCVNHDNVKWKLEPVF